MNLYLKHRPDKLRRIIGNEKMIKSLSTELEKEDPAHVYLLHGQTGCGKTTIARIIGTTLGCIGSDFKEINTADFRGIDSARDIIKACQFKAMEGPCRVYLIDECHKLTKDAQNALLKVFEDTPSHVYFVLCTTDPQDLISTLKGRCLIFQVNPLTDEEMERLLRRTTKLEEAELDDKVYTQIINSSNGLPRNALQLLQQVLSVPEEMRLETAKRIENATTLAVDLCKALIRGATWKEIAAILTELKEEEPETVRRIVLGYCGAILLKGTDKPVCGLIMEFFINPFYDTPKAQLLHACYSIVKN